MLMTTEEAHNAWFDGEVRWSARECRDGKLGASKAALPRSELCTVYTVAVLGANVAWQEIKR